MEKYKTFIVKIEDTCLTAPGALAHCLQRHTAKKSNMTAKGLQNCQQGLKRCLPLDLWVLHQLSQNKCFNPNTPSMRKVDNGEKQK